MKRIASILVLGVFAVMLIGAQPMTEQAVSEPTVIKLAVMAGPTGFSSVGLTRNEGNIAADVQVDVQVYPSPNEVIARLANGELDAACLPTNVAANLANKKVPIKLAAVVGNGMLYVLSNDPAIKGASDLLGKTLYVPGAGSTPDQMSRLLLKQAGLQVDKDVMLNYSVGAPAQLAQMVIAGKVSLAILPEPFVSMVLAKNPAVRTVVDVQQLYRQLANVETYPMSVLVVRESFARNQSRALALLLKAYEDSVAWVNADPGAAGKAIEAASIMNAAMATPAIPSCNLVFVPSQQAKTEVQAYFSFLAAFNPEAIGGKVPSVDLYL
ncbi:MAG: ABC transporter substrate-binding protein [Sphaerochaeta sp.]|uniref:ABC transporter substrate-binding protein n=1 Tax=Sphaerochaeta sp. TaxID=1972642 RepID=UPI003D0BA1A2